eukprot:GHVU01085372.1.p1 GENE.GHVU01085372.1~~GHVU01085372.1.p1  ORF type:complete len:292 (-),score=39.09 GHVU01085372.1:500-1375(-)
MMLWRKQRIYRSGLTGKPVEMSKEAADKLTVLLERGHREVVLRTADGQMEVCLIDGPPDEGGRPVCRALGWVHDGGVDDEHPSFVMYRLEGVPSSGGNDSGSGRGGDLEEVDEPQGQAKATGCWIIDFDSAGAWRNVGTRETPSVEAIVALAQSLLSKGRSPLVLLPFGSRVDKVLLQDMFRARLHRQRCPEIQTEQATAEPCYGLQLLRLARTRDAQIISNDLRPKQPQQATSRRHQGFNYSAEEATRTLWKFVLYRRHGEMQARVLERVPQNISDKVEKSSKKKYKGVR